MTQNPISRQVLHSTTLYTSAAEALAGMLPTTEPVNATLYSADRHRLLEASGLSVAASFVGQQSADVLLVIAEDKLGPLSERRSARLSAEDLLRPSLEAATGVLGAGVLSTETASGAEALLADTDTVCFELNAGSEPVGYFALRLREHSATSEPGQEPAPEQDVASRLSRINNVEMALTVEIGRTRMSVRDVLGLEPGAVVELDRSAGAPADILLNGRLIAQGEVVVMDQDYGVRITQILDTDGGTA